MSSWSPIKDAPKDGRKLLISDDEGEILVGHWHEPSKCWMADSGGYDNEYPIHYATFFLPVPTPPKFNKE